MRAALVALVIGHAAVHVVMWTLPFTDAVRDMPFDPADSWALGHRPVLAASLAGIAAAGFVGGAIGVALGGAWWRPLLVASGAASLLLMSVFWSRYWTVGIAISVALIVSAVRAGPM